jgi:hypothetical protein
VTALTVPARPGHDGVGLRPVPWRRMAGVTWRQHRTALVGVAVLLGVLAVWLWIAGTSLHHAYAAATACHRASPAACNSLVGTFNGMDTFLWDTIPRGAFLQLVPALIGAFAGAPVLARELETGTFRYAWTQGFGRWRWALAKLVLLGVVLAAAAAAFSVLVSWHYQPYFAAGNQALGLNEDSPFVVFNLREVAFPAWTLAAFAIGALAGTLIRRVVPAIVATLAAYAGLAVATGGVLREHYLTPLSSTSLNLPANVWITSQWWTRNGRFAFTGRPSMDLINQYCSVPPGGKSVLPGGKPSPATFAQCLAQHGYTQWTGYQPASRFWPSQWIEGGWLLALSALLIAVTIWLVQRRAA